MVDETKNEPLKVKKLIIELEDGRIIEEEFTPLHSMNYELSYGIRRVYRNFSLLKIEYTGKKRINLTIDPGSGVDIDDPDEVI